MNMTLVHPLLPEPIAFTEDKIAVLVVEAPKELRKMIFALQQQEAGHAGEFVLAEKFMPVEFSKYAALVTDPYALDFAAKKIAAKLTQQALAAAKEAYGEQLMAILAELNALAAGISTMLDFEVAFSEMESPEALVKQMDFHIDRQLLDFPEQVLEYAKLQQRVFGKKLVIFYNLKACLTEEEVKLLYKALRYEKIPLLLLEDRQRPGGEEDENVTIIDKDLCVF